MAQAKTKAKGTNKALNLLSEADFRRALKAEPPRGGYLFFGEEDYMKLTLLRMVQDAVCPADDPMATFNSLRLDGLDLTAARLLDAMAAPPMGAERKLITVTGVNFNAPRRRRRSSARRTGGTAGIPVCPADSVGRCGCAGCGKPAAQSVGTALSAVRTAAAGLV